MIIWYEQIVSSPKFLAKWQAFNDFWPAPRTQVLTAYGVMAQLVEHKYGNLDVTGSNPALVKCLYTLKTILYTVWNMIREIWFQ